jgi:hypothetical protein
MHRAEFGELVHSTEYRVTHYGVIAGGAVMYDVFVMTADCP